MSKEFSVTNVFDPEGLLKHYQNQKNLQYTNETRMYLDALMVKAEETLTGYERVLPVVSTKPINYGLIQIGEYMVFMFRKDTDQKPSAVEMRLPS